MRAVFVLPLILALTACGSEPVPAPSPQENAQLDEAENMLDNLAAPPAER